MDVSSRLHVAEYVILQIGNRLQRIRHVLIALDVTNDFGGFGSFSEVDEMGLLDD